MKAKQKNIKKTSIAEKATVPGQRLHLDLSKLTVKSETPDNVAINQDNWKVMFCKATGKKWIDFTVTNNDMVEHTCEHLNKLKAQDIPARYIYLDPAGEKNLLAKHAGSRNWAVLQPLDFDYTSQDTHSTTGLWNWHSHTCQERHMP